MPELQRKPADRTLLVFDYSKFSASGNSSFQILYDGGRMPLSRR